MIGKFGGTEGGDDADINRNSIIEYSNSKLYINLTTGLNIHYTNSFIDNHDSKVMFKILERRLVYNTVDESKVLIHGKYVEIPRNQAAYGDPGTFYRFAGNVVHAKNWFEDGPVETILRKVCKKLEVYTGTKFNFVLINKYVGGNQYIGFHSDDEKDLDGPVKIAGVSLGGARPIYFQNKKTGVTDLKVNLEGGSVIVMNYPTNTFWKHSIPKTSKNVGTRISLTYRKMICK
jgi:alpha-ketoglutarate-dependent dioxygenase alkB family protein 2